MSARRSLRWHSYQDFLASVFWADLREQKLRLNPRCEKCSTTLRLQVHHRFYRQLWEHTEVGDLETLCFICHSNRHGQLQKRKKLMRFIPNRQKAEVSRILSFNGSPRKRKGRTHGKRRPSRKARGVLQIKPHERITGRPDRTAPGEVAAAGNRPASTGSIAESISLQTGSLRGSIPQGRVESSSAFVHQGSSMEAGTDSR